MNLQIWARGTMITAAAGLLLVATVAQAAGADLTATPSNVSVATGATVTVDFREDSDSMRVNAMQLNLSYPADKLDVVSIDGSDSAFGVKAQETRSNGSIVVARGSLKALIGSQEVAKVTFRGKAAGNAAVTLAKGSALVGADNNTDVLSTETGATLVSVNVTATGSDGGSTTGGSKAAPVVKAAPAAIAPQPTLTPGDVPQPGLAMVPHQIRDLPATKAVAIAGGGIGLGSIGYVGAMWYRRRKSGGRGPSVK